MVGDLHRGGGGGALLAIGRFADLRRRRAAAAGVAVAALALTLLAAGAADELLKPSGWDTLLAGIGRGLGALPSLHLPYRGVDAWTRFVIVAGAIALLVGAVLLAFWPRRAGLGFRLPRSWRS